MSKISNQQLYKKKIKGGSGREEKGYSEEKSYSPDEEAVMNPDEERVRDFIRNVRINILPGIDNFWGNQILDLVERIEEEIDFIHNEAVNEDIQDHIANINELIQMASEESESSSETKTGAGIRGGAIKDWISPTAWSDYASAIVKGRNDYPPKMRDLIKKYGNVPILRMTACRTPVPSLLTSALNAVSFGEFNKRWENQPYDTLFHLDLRLELATRPTMTTILLEKNEVLNASLNPKKSKDTECSLIPKNKLVTLNQLLDGAKKLQGDKFFKYSAYNNNCQDFIIAVLQGSGLGTQSNFEFIKQDTKELFKGLPGLRKFANTITDLGSAVNTITQGTGINQNLNHPALRSNPMDANFHFRFSTIK